MSSSSPPGRPRETRHRAARRHDCKEDRTPRQSARTTHPSPRGVTRPGRRARARPCLADHAALRGPDGSKRLRGPLKAPCGRPPRRPRCCINLYADHSVEWYVSELLDKQLPYATPASARKAELYVHKDLSSKNVIHAFVSAFKPIPLSVPR